MFKEVSKEDAGGTIVAVSAQILPLAPRPDSKSAKRAVIVRMRQHR